MFFIKDKLKQIVILQIISLLITSGIVWIIKNGGDNFVWYLWIFSMVMMFIMMLVYPEFIAPLFDKYSPLPKGELREQIEALAESLNFPLYKLYIVEGSKRSSHSNAYMYGFHKNKRIVLFDTLVKEYYTPSENEPIKDQGCENDEVVGILAHELGHWKMNHVWKNILLIQVHCNSHPICKDKESKPYRSNFLLQISILINFYSFGMLLHYRPMYVAFGFNHSQPILIGLIIVLMHILIPINEVRFLFFFIFIIIRQKIKRSHFCSLSVFYRQCAREVSSFKPTTSLKAWDMQTPLKERWSNYKRII